MRSELARYPNSNALPDVKHQADPSHVLLARFLSVRARTEALAAPLSPEECQVSVTGDTSPPKWHLAHTTWFFERMVLSANLPDYRPFDPAYDFLFNSYYETVGAFLPKKRRPQIARPGVAEILEYRRVITARVEEFLRAGAPAEARAVIELGVNHEEQHQELLLMDIKQNFFVNPLRPAYRKQTAAPAASAPYFAFREFGEGLHHFGHAGADFAYDNEGGRHRAWLEPYALGSRLVTNGEYREFVEAGAYRDPRLWLADGWDYLRDQKVSAPLYWEARDGAWFEFTLAGERELDPAAPVSHISYYEAAAFAQWKGARLPTEYEWEAAAPKEVRGQFLESDSPAPAAASAGPLAQFHGTLWEWTSSAYLAYPGYRPYDSSLAEYNGKFMCNQMVLRGGSFATSRPHYRPTYRNFFYPPMRWQFGGFRLARSL